MDLDVGRWQCSVIRGSFMLEGLNIVVVCMGLGFRARVEAPLDPKP